MITIGFVIGNKQHQARLKRSTYPAGEEFVEVQDLVNKADVATVRAKVCNSSDVMALFQVLDIVKATKPKELRLYLPYLPYSRQDRKMKPGQSNSLKLFGKMLNSFDLDYVGTLDVHSNVAETAIDNLHSLKQSSWVVGKCLSSIKKSKFPVLVSPDVGAYKKSCKLAEELDLPMVQALKTRKEDGSVTTDVYGSVEGKDCFIFDDIIDGGATAVGLAKKLKTMGASSVHLLVSHAIFSKGLGVVLESIDTITCTNLLCEQDQEISQAMANGQLKLVLGGI